LCLGWFLPMPMATKTSVNIPPVPIKLYFSI
jgi:hypothetical protein